MSPQRSLGPGEPIGPLLVMDVSLKYIREVKQNKKRDEKKKRGYRRSPQ